MPHIEPVRRTFGGFLTVIFFALAMAMPAPFASAQDATAFAVEEINPGLGEVPSDLDRATPQTAMEEFLFAIEGGNYARAAHLLDLSDLDEGEAAERGPELARKLAVVLDRKVVLSWPALLERPDSLEVRTGADDPMAGQPRKSLLLGLLEIGDRAVAIRLNRLSEGEGGETAWLFSRQTVANIDELYRLYGPTAFEQAMPDWLKRDTFLGFTVWELLGIPILAVVTYWICLLAWRLITRMADGASRAKKLPVAEIIRGLRMPAVLVLAGIIVQAATSYVFVLSGLLSNIAEPLVVLAFVSAGMVLAVNVIDALLEEFFDVEVEDLSSEENADVRARVTTLSAVRRLVIALAVVAGTGFVLATANVFQTLGFSLLASAGALTLVLGFAARDVLGNIMSSMQISLNRTARIGDVVVFDGYYATVERITFTVVQLKVWNGTRLIVPVKTFVDEAFENWSIETAAMKRAVKLDVDPATDLGPLREEFERLCRDDDRIDEDDIEMVVVDQSYGYMTLRFAFLCPHPATAWGAETELRAALIDWLVKRGEGADRPPLPQISVAAE